MRRIHDYFIIIDSLDIQHGRKKMLDCAFLPGDEIKALFIFKSVYIFITQYQTITQAK